VRKLVRGFTIVELLVALAITSLLVVLLVNVVNAALSVWQQGRNQIDTFANARQTLGRIADEIEGAIASPSPRSVEFTENLPSIQGTTSPVSGTSENVFFVAPYPNSNAGDLCVVAYRHNNDTHTLERGFISSQTAWGNGAPTRYQSGGYSSTDWQWRVVADGVLEFEIQSYSQADLDASPAPSPTPTPISWDSINSGAPMTGNTPRRITIRIKVVDDKTLVKLVGLAPGNPTYDRLVARAAREFTRDVTLLPPH
jgi:prepilin-type N-terminal cleavage/methylation domain-containing protein